MMNDVIWKPVVGYEGLYEVSSAGDVMSLDRFIIYSDGTKHLHKGRMLSIGTDNHGYQSVVLSMNKRAKTYLVHRLVAEAFIPNENNLPEVNHRDENKSNNRADNLEWCTGRYNSNYGTRGQRLSKALKGRVFSNETLIKMSDSHKGVKLSDEVRKHISDGHKGIKFTEEHKQKISEKRIAYFKRRKETEHDENIS